MNAAIFLDKDGTLIPDIPYNIDPKRIVLYENSVAGLKLLHDMGYKLIVISNQPGVAHGYFTEEALLPVKRKLGELLAAHQIKLSGFHYCPHHTTGLIEEYTTECFCRKPSPGMLYHAASVHDINLAASWMIGDILNDIEAGNRAGCRTILIDNGNETEWLDGEYRTPAQTCASLNEAAQFILNEEYASTRLA
ncbi:MAG: D-glycero-alpha-D-manno-heptose-1,7-bisphosphate 7-phosphatase [Mucilaginibacter sp.]